MAASFEHELPLWEKGYLHIAGLDEVGRGAWAGPVVTAAVVFPTNAQLDFELDDSKKLSPLKRQKLVIKIKETALAYSYGFMSNEVIDRYGIVPATQRAMHMAIVTLKIKPTFHLIDAFLLPTIPESNQRAIIKGDAISNSIAAASILAKEYRDDLMRELDTNDSMSKYLFGKHKGYGTKQHQEAIKEHGLCTLHRKTFISDSLKKR
ncbi:ribonuclease HII [candidate division WWE3 bacterium]|uniref:Ribonuclease n=1 Tax=candidate division WWE3 bacterium TaxID=2053526 RepID=A0A955RWV8_UNCKA|nr:ribonuclease HII [candidate division WWE3 bacterium]